MIPNYYECSSCRQSFEFSFREVYYRLGAEPVDGTVLEDELVPIPVRPAWCKDCSCLSLVEDIAPLRHFELAYGAVKQGRPIDYPVSTDCCAPNVQIKVVGAYLRWRMGRKRRARALCCGGTNYIFMDEAQRLIKHAECDFGFIEGKTLINSYCGTGPGILSPAKLRLYSSEGDLIGLLTWHRHEESRWEVTPASYPPTEGDLL